MKTRNAAASVLVAAVAVITVARFGATGGVEIPVGPHATAPTPYSIDHERAQARAADEALPPTF